MTPARREGYYVVLTDRVFDKLRSIDITLAEFEALLRGGEVIKESQVEDGIKELVRISEWYGGCMLSSWMTSARRSIS